MSHTPGPWEALRREGPFGEVWDVLARNLGPDYDATSSRWIAEDRSEADARLIAAAPDLLAACQEALSWIGGEGDSLSLQLREAIAKATQGNLQ